MAKKRKGSIMQRGEGESVSIWHEALAEGGLHPLRENVSVEVCVVGAGISGLSTAYMLAKEGKSVVVVDAWGIGAGETGRTTAHLSAVLDDRFFKLERIYGQKGATLAAESHMSAIHRIEQIATEENIKCDFERLDGYLAAPTSSQRKDFYQEAEATLRAGFADRQVLERMPVEGVEIGPVMRFPQQATFHLGKYLQGLARAFQALGGSIYTGTHVKEVQGGAKPFAITDDGYRIRAGAIVVATNTPVNDRVKMHTKQAAYRSYVVAYEVPRRTYAPFLLWDMQEPYHYVRIVHGRKCDMLLVGGEDHKTGQANDAGERYQRLDEWAQTYFTTLGPIRYRWSGQVMEPVDSLAFIGLNPGEENVYIATGDSGHGITHGTIAGMLLTDLIQGRRNPWQELYDPARKPLHSLASYIEENANAVGCMTKDWLGPGEVSSARELAPGNGAVIRSGLSKLAVYKDEQGRVHQCSAVCPHLGCIVQWNAGEKSWDCPCHGSRFDVEGRILNGPALRRLDQAEAAEKPAKEVRWKKVK